MTRIASAQWLDLVTLACSALRSRVPPAGASPATSGGPENGTCGRFPVPGGRPCHRADFHPVLTELTRQPLSGELAGFHQPTGLEQPFQLCSSTSPSLACSSSSAAVSVKRVGTCQDSSSRTALGSCPTWGSSSARTKSWTRWSRSRSLARFLASSRRASPRCRALPAGSRRRAQLAYGERCLVCALDQSAGAPTIQIRREVGGTSPR
jgi:hypothetical protein